MRFAVVLFDLDGTLTDPVVGITNSIRHALTALELDPLTDVELRRWVGPPLHGSFASLGLSPDRVFAAVDAYREYFVDRGLYENAVYPEIDTVLVALRSAGLRLGVATSEPTVFAERILEHFRLAEHFDAVVGAELDGTRIEKRDLIIEAMSQLDGCALDTTLMVGDRSHDIRGARLAGIDAIGVAWGYGAPGELAEAGASFIATTREELSAAVLRPNWFDRADANH